MHLALECFAPSRFYFVQLLNFEKKWLHKVELLEAHSQTVNTSEIYVSYCLHTPKCYSSTASKQPVDGRKPKMGGPRLMVYKMQFLPMNL